MHATLVNATAVIIGASFGIFLKGRIMERYLGALTVGVGLITLVLGMTMALGKGSFFLVLFALILGGLLGTALKIETRILSSGNLLRKLLSSSEDNSQFSKGFLDATVLFCVGPMTIVGSLESGLYGNNDIILTKSVMDGSMAIVLAASSGAGVLVSSLSILVIQGGITLAARALAPLATDSMLAEISALGGYLILMIALNLLDIKRVKTANFLPALVLVVLFAWIRDSAALSYFQASIWP